MKAPPKRKGNIENRQRGTRSIQASMKALPKRKGNGFCVMLASRGPVPQ